MYIDGLATYQSEKQEHCPKEQNLKKKDFITGSLKNILVGLHTLSISLFLLVWLFKAYMPMF